MRFENSIYKDTKHLIESLKKINHEIETCNESSTVTYDYDPANKTVITTGSGYVGLNEMRELIDVMHKILEELGQFVTCVNCVHLHECVLDESCGDVDELSGPCISFELKEDIFQLF